MTEVSKVVGEQKTYAVFILDESGSMAVCKQATIQGFNEQVQTVKKNAAKEDSGKYFIGVVKFNSEVTPLKWNAPVAELEELTEETYKPDTSTAMLDGVGQALTQLKATTDTEDANTAYLIYIISDGQENASKQFSYAQVGEMIQELQKTGRWTFTYMGANQDLSVINRTLNIPMGNMANYSSDVVGTAKAFKSMSRNTERYMAARKIGLCASSSFHSGFEGVMADYDKDEPDVIDAPAVEEKKDESAS